MLSRRIRQRRMVLAARLGAPVLLFFLCCGTCAADAASSVVDFQRDVRPILAGHCFKCHGPDPQIRKAGFRLDQREPALSPASSGGTPIVPGKPEESELVRRILSQDDNEVMPPPEAKIPLTENQKEMLQRWVREGASYAEHWAFVPPQQAALPSVEREDWPRNGLDHFVLARLEREGLTPSPAADPYTLVRRLYLDLIGLPPSPEELDASVRELSAGKEKAYHELVDRLLASPHYGERWARRWLDLARYADTNGFEKDRPRSVWPYRDWVIQALNQDMPFDQFTIEQIAGDLLPDATPDQRVATGFHRNTMLNEEGGIDPLEYRFYSLVDRVNTTATVWLGLTLGCAQCHTHKFDPIEQREYYEFMAFLNQADEPEMIVPDAEVSEQRRQIEKEIERRLAALPSQFPVEEFIWDEPEAHVFATPGTETERLSDGSYRLTHSKEEPPSVTTFAFQTGAHSIEAIEFEFLQDEALPKNGPGTGPEGEARIAEIEVSMAPSDQLQRAQTLKILRATADFSDADHPVEAAFDADPESRWLVRGTSPGRKGRRARFFIEPVAVDQPAHWIVRLRYESGKPQAAGRLRLRLGTRIQDDRPLEVRRREQLDSAFAAWLEEQEARTVRWQPLEPIQATSNLPRLNILEDHSVLATGDQTKRDLYEITLRNPLQKVTAIRLEALPDPRLPKDGPGRVYYEGPHGDFFLSELKVTADGREVALTNVSHSFANGRLTASAAIDGDPQTGWSINGGQGRAHTAVFNLVEPLDGGEWRAQLLFERYHAAGLGRFRISATSDPGPSQASPLSLDLQRIVELSVEERSPEQRRKLLEEFLVTTPALAEAQAEIEELRRRLPPFPTTLVLQERPTNHLRQTFVHKRGEFLQPTEQVQPDVPDILHPLPPDRPRDRLTLARWLVDPASPLVGRVVVNRHWAAFFGAGLVETIEDFGYQGALPTHPELLDWLALEFVRRGWSLKELHRLIVTSATYRQSSSLRDELLERDPENRLLARASRVRLEAELIRDLALKASGTLSAKIGGPSVFPPQPPGVTTEGTYGPLEWKVSDGPDRFRRGLYTFSKRTAPYAMFLTFDASSGEACVARREISNSPLQALTLMNDTVFLEAAQALGRWVARQSGSPEERAALLFRRCLSRPPDAHELKLLVEFYGKQKRRLDAGELPASVLVGQGLEGTGGTEGTLETEVEGAAEEAAWAAVARVLFNLDETITKS